MISFQGFRDIRSELDIRLDSFATGDTISGSRRLSAIGKRYLSFLSLLVPAFLILGGYAVVKAQQGSSSSSAVKGGRWSDAATWSGKKVPAEGAAVTIDKGMDVVLD